MNYLEKRAIALATVTTDVLCSSEFESDVVKVPRLDEVLRRVAEGMPAPKGVPGEVMYDTDVDGDSVDPANSYGFDKFDYVEMQRDAARQKYVQSRQNNAPSSSESSAPSSESSEGAAPTPPSE